MKNKVFSVGMTIVLVAGIFLGCSQSAEPTPSQTPSTPSETPSASNAESASPVQLLIPTMPPGTITYVTTETLTPYFNKALPAGSRIERSPTATGDVSGVLLLRAGQGDFYLTSDVPAHWVWEGKPYANIDSAYTGFRKLLSFEPYAGSGFFVSKSLVEQHNLKTVDDLLESGVQFSVTTWPSGSAAIIMVEQILQAYGFENLDDFKSKGYTVLQGSPQDMVKYVRDRQADAYFGYIVGHDFPPIEEMTSSVDLVLLPFGEDKMKEINEEFGYAPFVIPEGAYKGVTAATDTFGVGGYFIVPETMDDDTAYRLTKAMYDNWDELREKDPFLSVAPMHFRESMIPYHPGAEKYLKEVGAIQ